MGYYTDYELDIDGTVPEQFGADFGEQTGYDLDSLSEVKWYSHVNDMKLLSLKYADTLFILKGDGEEVDDSWIKYFKNGKMQHCPAQITFEAYDESKLK